MLLRSFLFGLWICFANAANNGLARTPPMGWMSWTKYYCEIDCNSFPNGCINQDLYMAQADRMVSDGFLAVGYDTVHIDDCWEEWNRSADGKLVANRTRFPSGINGLAKYMHDRNLKLGIYNDVGFTTCQGYPGGFGYEEVDAQTYADWGVDYLKYDGCYANDSMRNVGFPKMGTGLLKTGRPIVFSTEWWDTDNGNLTAVSLISNLQREGYDIAKSWDSIMATIDHFSQIQGWFIYLPTGPGFWIDTDMIVVGNYELTQDQAKVQMSIWAIWSAPLIMSNDLRNMPAGHKEILQNKYVIAVDQDPMGVWGQMIGQNGTIMTFVKRMTPCYGDNCSYAIALLNRDDTTYTKATNYSFVFSDVLNAYKIPNGYNSDLNPNGYNVMDLWAGKIVGTYKPSDTYSASINPFGVHFIKAIVQQ